MLAQIGVFDRTINYSQITDHNYFRLDSIYTRDDRKNRILLTNRQLSMRRLPLHTARLTLRRGTTKFD